MQRFSPQLLWIAEQRERMTRLVADWAAINTSSENVPGIHGLLDRLESEFAPLGGVISRIALPARHIIDAAGLSVSQPLADALSIVKHPDAPVRVLLVIHTDTVYPSSMTIPIVDDSEKLHGPGVADAKGGIAVMLTALAALERSEMAGKIGWQVILNSDEELGSPGSDPLLRKLAVQFHAGLVFEPALPDGALVGARGGSGMFALVLRGKSAHVGRDFAAGRSAILAAARAALDLHKMNENPGVIVNVGKIDGGGPANVVADLAIVRFNVRVQTLSDQEHAQRQINEIVAAANSQDGISAELSGGFHAPPKPMDKRTAKLFDVVEASAKELSIPFSTRPTGGVCDGNKLAAAGLPVVDTLGPVGGELHSPGEYVIIDSLVQRAQLAALTLAKLAEGNREL
ncbi:MAG TPA: hydrolase [Tepidisphaeraceae bacterium]|nr:hydrolase [Tepidisphaeraceae bacterium]